MYSRLIPFDCEQFMLDKLMILGEKDQISLIKNKAPEEYGGKPALSQIHELIKTCLVEKDANLDQEEGTFEPERHTPFKLYCAICRQKHTSAHC